MVGIGWRLSSISKEESCYYHLAMVCLFCFSVAGYQRSFEPSYNIRIHVQKDKNEEKKIKNKGARQMLVGLLVTGIFSSL